ncbi:hypothetical protein ACI8AC_23990 [Geodermatophilus sp. SYSU D00758]
MSAHADGTAPALFLVELRAGAGGASDVRGMCRALRHAVSRLRNAGIDVRWCGALHLPDQARCLCLVEAEHRASVVLARDTAGLPAGSVVPAVCVGAPVLHPAKHS